MRTVWTDPARRDLVSLVSYVAERNPDAGRKVHASIRRSVEGLSEFPNRGRPGRIEGTRELVVVGTPYIVVYRIREATVRILRVLHDARNLPSWLEED
jgi:toxin ParE1/3/4